MFFCIIVNLLKIILTSRAHVCYNQGMEFVLKELKNEISVGRIANVHFFEFEKNFFTDNDRHPFLELVFVSSGELMVRSDEYNGILVKNEMILHRASESHSLSCTEKNSPTIIIIGFECEGNDLSEFSKRPTLLSDDSIKELAEIVKVAREVFMPPYNKPTLDMKKKRKIPYGKEQLLKILIEKFLINLKSVYEKTSKHREEASLARVPLIRDIIAYTDDNFLEKITIDELAFLFNTNRATLCKEFKRATGKTLISYISDKKTELAKKIIASSEITFTEVAERLNFESVHYFTRFFKKETGMTPKEFKLKSGLVGKDL